MKATKRLGGAAALAAALLVLPPASASEPGHVHVLDTQPIPSFDPEVVVIAPGDAIEWDNHADRLHTVTHVTCKRADARFDECEFDSVFTLTPGSVFSHTFERVGSFEYKCTIHGFLGRVDVVEPGGALPDLVVDALAAYDTALPTSKRLEARIANVGGATAVPSKVLFQYRNADGTWIDIGEPAVPAIGPGAFVVINQSWITYNKVGDFPVRAIADATFTVLEEDDDANDREIVVPVLLPPGIAPGIALPDPPP